LVNDGPLDSVVHCGEFEGRATGGRCIKMAVSIHCLVVAPTGGAMVNDDVADRIAAKAALAVEHTGVTATEAHITNHDVMRVHESGFTGDADAVAGSGMAVNS